ncbi:MAG: NUDIX hydrolase [Bacteroidales bacterium]|nr:NUDIX hydrolase [Bacteroidales bacterium]
MSYSYSYPRPAVAADCMIFRQMAGGWEVLLIRRGNHPFEGMWALPGGFMEMDETLEHAASRELEEETGLTNIKLRQFRTYSGIDRDPRHRTIGVVFFGFSGPEDAPKAGDDAREAAWFPINQLPPLAFDHELILREALQELLD